MLQLFTSYTADYRRFNILCTLSAYAFNSSQIHYKNTTVSPIQSVTLSGSFLNPAKELTRFKDNRTKSFFLNAFSCVLKRLWCCPSSWSSCNWHITGTVKGCVLSNPNFFSLCALFIPHSFLVKSADKRRRMSLVHVLARQSIKPGLFLSAFEVSKFSRYWLRKGSNCMRLRHNVTSVLWNESWKVPFCRGPLNVLLARHSAWLLFGLCTCSIAAGTGTVLGPPALAEPLVGRPEVDEIGSCGIPVVSAGATPPHGKQVLTNYSVIAIPGDGRCMFRAIAHGAHVRKGKGAPSESLQRQSADDLREQVVNELVKRRAETEWFIEGDFDTYTRRMRQPHVWGGEPELLMASHVLRMPITVYMFEQRSRGLISIAEYGQEYAKESPVPIRVLYHGYGHYEALELPHQL
eukprot:c14961_g1_i1 orf=576-1793(-)